MEKVYKELADELIAKLNTRSRLLVGIAGVPGSGKSTAAKEISRIINQKNSNMAVVVPMDGFHFYRSELDAMPDPKEAHDRRGAPFTFNAEKFHRLLQQIKETGAAKAPSFDHSVKDPKEDDIEVVPEHKIIIVEGNYLFLEEKIWNDIAYLFDERWFVDCDIDEAMKRVFVRHVKHIGFSAEVSKERIANNDRPNAVLIVEKGRSKATRFIKSEADEKFAEK
jgi:pantothenate kinase